MPAPDDALRNLRILPVEDDPLIRLDLEWRLAELGASVTAAADVSRALAAFDAAAFDFALLDFELSAGTGEPVAEAARTRNVPFIYLSGTAKMMSASVSGPGVGVLAKALSADGLARGIRDALEARR